MKIRRGFVTNSSSTNDIFQALGTAGAAAVLGTVINTIQPAENVEIITYAILETFHVPEEPRPPVVRVNDTEYVPWYYAGVRMIDVQHVTDEETGEVETTVLRDEYSAEYASSIKYDFDNVLVEKWLTFFAGSESDPAGMQGDYKICGFMCESPANDSPRKQRPSPPGMMSFNVTVNVEGNILSTYKQTQIRNEADVYAYDGFVLNDPQVKTRLPVRIINKDKYQWKPEVEVEGSRLEELVDIELKKLPTAEGVDEDQYELILTPRGLNLGTEEKPAKRFDGSVEISAKANADHLEEIWDRADITLMDEGLIYRATLDDERRVIVKAYDKAADENQVADGEEVELPPTEFKLELVVEDTENEPNTTAKYVDIWETEIEFKELKGTDRDTETLVEAFKYEVESEGSTGTYLFKPKMQVPSRTEPYIVHLPILCKYDGEEYELDMPINLQGEPWDYFAAWEEEYRNLRIIVKKYIPPERWYDILTNINDNKESLSIAELRLMRHALWYEARALLTAEAAGYQREALMYEWAEWGASWVEWVGNQAFSYLMTVYTGPIGEAIITPFKEMAIKILAQKIADWNFEVAKPMTDDEINRAGLGAVFASVENLIGQGADDMVDATKLSYKQIGRYFAAYAVVKCVNHYMCDRTPDNKPIGLWDAIVATCSDLTSGVFKMLVSTKLKKLLTDLKFMDAINDYTIKKFQTTLVMKYPNWESEGLEILAKYVDGIAGVVSAKVYNEVQGIATTRSMVKEGDDYIVTFNLSNDPKKPLIIKISLNTIWDEVCDYIFEGWFGHFPFATEAVTVSEDPKYFKKRA